MRPVKLGIAVCGMLICNGVMADAAPPIGTVALTVDERGVGLVDFGFGNVAFNGVLAPDPGPGGLQSALTFGLVGLSFPNEPPLTEGDVLITSSATGTLLDILRFNPADTGVDPQSNPLDLADTPVPPSSFYDNTLTVLEAGTEGPITFSVQTRAGPARFRARVYGDLWVGPTGAGTSRPGNLRRGACRSRRDPAKAPLDRIEVSTVPRACGLGFPHGRQTKLRPGPRD